MMGQITRAGSSDSLAFDAATAGAEAVAGMGRSACKREPGAAAADRIAGEPGPRMGGALPSVPPGDVDLRHGYTLGGINRLARAAVSRDVFHQSLPFAERLETAWSAIVECLYAADEAPRSGDLIRAGWNGLRARVEDEWRTHGIGRAGVIDGDATMVNFWRYWWPQTRATPSPEDRVVDRLALAQIWPLLTPTYQRLLLALAVHDDYGRAAEALQRPRGSFTTHVSAARREFLGWWHQGETPSRVWVQDRRRFGRQDRPHWATTAVRRRSAARRRASGTGGSTAEGRA
ncbi:hypothetical protein AB0M46_00225 [Dactylosporangium sp. NPDC051485]|uniref:hypothetical protein n=1 Tax=Dactylosporangium sp. NPDC051485 TaxID=3154846 RepID=UPI0034244AA2